MVGPDSMPQKTVPADSNESRTALSVIINGKQVRTLVPDRLLLSDFLRDYLGLTALKVACGEGACGACTIVIDGEPARSCTLLAVQTDGSDPHSRRNECFRGTEPRAANLPTVPCLAVRILHAGMADYGVLHDEEIHPSGFG